MFINLEKTSHTWKIFINFQKQSEIFKKFIDFGKKGSENLKEFNDFETQVH